MHSRRQEENTAGMSGKREEKMKLLYEQMGGIYTLSENGIYYPDLTLQEAEKARYGKYGMLRRTYLKEKGYALPH